jgi:SAM-dependent methyltransferase
VSEEIPATRWELGDNSGFAAHFRELIAAGQDVEGEARLADAMLPRGATVLDAGAGFGRIGAALQARGHRVVAVEKDPDLVAMAAEHHPDLPMLRSDILALTPDRLAEAGLPTSFDLVVLVGNVIVLIAPDTEQQVLRTLAALLADGGRMLVGFHITRMHGSARDYPFEEFRADVEAAGLRVQHRFGSYDLAPADDAYCVAVLSR